MNKPTFPALVFLLVAWLAIDTITGVIILTWKTAQTVWGYLHPQPSPIPSMAIYAPIFEQLDGEPEVVQPEPSPVVQPMARPRKRKVSPTMSALIQAEAQRNAS